MNNESIMNETVLTLDVDWAPDFMIDFAAQILLEHRVRATWFITHDSPALQRLRAQPDLFELGIHPNFLTGSTHGQTPEAVLRHCMSLVPEALSLRTHALYQSTPLLARILASTPIRNEASLYLPHAPSLFPFEYEWHGRTLLRIPHFWEDDFEMARARPIWSLEPLLKIGSGLKVFDFHPIHVYLNSCNFDPYEALKQQVPNLVGARQSDVASCVQKGIGTRVLFAEVVEHLAHTGSSLRLKDIGAQLAQSGER
jgi:hypothetical protein